MEKFIPIVNRKECCKVWLDDVVYIENEGRRVKIVTDEKEFYLYAKVSDLSPYFDSDERFYPCMKGMVVKCITRKKQRRSQKNGLRMLVNRF